MSDPAFSEKLKEKTGQVTEIVSGFLPEEEGRQRILFEAMNYSVLAGGKRLRPMLMQETYRYLGGSREREADLLHPFIPIRLYMTICLPWTMICTEEES